MERVNDALAVRLHAVAIHLLRRLRREDDALGVSAARLSALSVVGFGGPHTLGDLAAAEQVTAPTMTRLVAALAADGLVTRTVDARDRRVVRIAATEQGLRILEEGRARRVARLSEQLATLTEGERATLTEAAALLERLLQEATGHAPAVRLVDEERDDSDAHAGAVEGRAAERYPVSEDGGPASPVA